MMNKVDPFPEALFWPEHPPAPDQGGRKARSFWNDWLWSCSTYLKMLCGFCRPSLMKVRCMMLVFESAAYVDRYGFHGPRTGREA